MKIRSYAVASVALATALAAGTANAGMIAGVSVLDVVPAPGVDRANTFNGNMTLRGQAFTTTSAVAIQSISFLANSPDGDDVTLYITDGLGESSSILYQGTFAVSEDAGTSSSWHTFELTDAILSQAGQYYLVVSSDGAGGFRMNKTNIEGSVGFGERVFSLLPEGSDFLGEEFAYFADGNVLIAQINGTVIPSPGAIALAGMSGLLLARRRRG